MMQTTTIYRFRFTFLLLLLFPWEAHTVLLEDSRYFNYEVLFTNPLCATYNYNSPVYSNSKELLKTKKKNVYCKFRDGRRSAVQDSSPQKRLSQWIADEETEEVFMTYLSFSNSKIARALCDAIKERDMKLTFVLDHPRNVSEEILRKSRKAIRYPIDEDLKEILAHDKMKRARYILNKCRASKEENNPVLYLRGHVNGINWSHNKLFIVNPNSEDKIKFVFSSGNMSSGVVLHHENWHFITTSVSTYFSQVHLCLRDAMLDYTGSGSTFKSYMARCRRDVAKKYKEEEDIKVFFVPAGEGKRALRYIRYALQNSDLVGVAAHRFSYSSLIDSFRKYLREDKELRLIVDDDIYWARDDSYRALERPNNSSELRRVESLVKSGMHVKYMETNHWDNLLHHNKFIVFFEREKAFAAFAGAGNFTASAFGASQYANNLENFYFIRIPFVVEVMGKQYDYMWNSLATAVEDMPKKNVSD